MVVIPGTTNPDHLRANIAAAVIAENLTDAEVARLTGLADESKAVIDQPHQSTPGALRSAAQSHASAPDEPAAHPADRPPPVELHRDAAPEQRLDLADVTPDLGNAPTSPSGPQTQRP